MMNKKKYFRKKPKKINFLLGAGAVIFIVILLIIATQKKAPNQPANYSSNKIIENIPNQREDINSQLTLEQRKKGQKLSPVEEKTIIESLASQVNIDKEKSYFDYG